MVVTVRVVAKPLRLSLASYVLLGAVDQAGPCTPYDLKRIVATRVGPLYELAHSQYYDETARLAKAGLLEETQEEDGRRRLQYALTSEGRRHLLRWLRMPDFQKPELRDTGLLKLAFADRLDPDEIGHLAREHAEVARMLCGELEDAAAQDEAPRAAHLNVALVRAMVAFWDELAEALPDRVTFDESRADAPDDRIPT